MFGPEQETIPVTACTTHTLLEKRGSVWQQRDRIIATAAVCMGEPGLGNVFKYGADALRKNECTTFIFKLVSTKIYMKISTISERE